MMEAESMEELAMTATTRERKAEKMERKRLRKLEEVKRALNLDDCYNDMPLKATDIAKVIVKYVEALKDPTVKAVLGSSWKKTVNSMVDVATSIKSAAMKEATDTLSKV